MAEPADRIHGDLDRDELVRLGVDSSRLLDLGVNVSPFGPHPELARAIREADLAAYPDRNARAAKRAIARTLGVPDDEVVLGHGAAELLWTGIRTFASAERPLLIVGPTFGEPEAAARAAGVPTIRVNARAASGFVHDLETIQESIRAMRPALVYVCQPNNPTGTSMGLAALDALVRANEDTRFLVDQAFLSLSDDHEDLVHRFSKNAIVIRSLTKDHALAGVRVAYALAGSSDVDLLDRSRPPWSITTAAQVAAATAMDYEWYVASTRSMLLAARDDLVPRLRALDLDVVDSRTFFVLVRTGSADALRARLLATHAIAVRSCASFGLPEHVRIAARDPESHERLCAALSAELGR